VLNSELNDHWRKQTRREKGTRGIFNEGAEEEKQTRTIHRKMFQGDRGIKA
jgi:hypothetical protein